VTRQRLELLVNDRLCLTYTRDFPEVFPLIKTKPELSLAPAPQNTIRFSRIEVWPLTTK